MTSKAHHPYKILFLSLLYFIIIQATAQTDNTIINIEACKTEKGIENKIVCIKESVARGITNTLNDERLQTKIPLLKVIDDYDFTITYAIKKNGHIRLGEMTIFNADLRQLIEELFTPGLMFNKFVSDSGQALQIDIEDSYKMSRNKKTNLLQLNPIKSIGFSGLIDTKACYKSCFKKKSKARSECTDRKMHNEIIGKLNKSAFKDVNLRGIIRAYISFEVNKSGEISKIRCRAPHPAIEEELLRIMRTIPNFIPASYKGIPVNMMFSLPVTMDYN